MAGESGTESHTWENPSSTAMVQFGGQAASGSLKVAVHDADGKQVYSKTYSGTYQSGGQERTSSGASGDWSVTLTFSDFTGQLGLNIASA